ncbi:MAG: 2-oxoacid:acceptor oxidoreductase family protein [Candidatus Pacebacteria bacterium]|nr:2-oxoacid:acceptor oxidoreductase family protein [Candidatus Paceibacterota bacterium]
MLQIRIHGRGGQGGKTAAEILATGAIRSDKYAKSFPEFGPERTGAPVQYYTKISNEEIKSNQPIIDPDVVVVLDDTLIGLVNFTDGLKEKGILVFNSSMPEEKIKENFGKYKIFVVDATKISFDLFQKNLPNVPMLGSILKATNVLDLDTIKEEVKEKFSFLPEDILEKNIKALEKGYNQIHPIK